MRRVRDVQDFELARGDRVRILGKGLFAEPSEHVGDDGTIVQLGASVVDVLIDGDVDVTQWPPRELVLRGRQRPLGQA
jgi:hypothetical protein